MKIEFLNTEIELEFANYQNNNNTYIGAVEVDSGESFMDITVNIDEKLKEDEVSIKNYSENEGILSVLVSAGIVSKPIRIVESGWVKIQICKLLKKS